MLKKEQIRVPSKMSQTIQKIVFFFQIVCSDNFKTRTITMLMKLSFCDFVMKSMGNYIAPIRIFYSRYETYISNATIQISTLNVFWR